MPDWVQQGQEDQKATWFFAAANDRYSLCGKRFWSRHKNNEKAQPTCENETIQNFKECTGTSKRLTGEGILNRMCVQSSLCQFCANYDKTCIGETGRTFGVRLQKHRTEVESKTGRVFTRSLRASSLTEHNKSALTDHATQGNHVINWSSATVIDREPEHFTRWIKEAIQIRKERQHGHEPWWGQLPTEPRIRPLSWHGVFPSYQEPEEMSTSFFWWRPLVKVETSSFR